MKRAAGPGCLTTLAWPNVPLQLRLESVFFFGVVFVKCRRLSHAVKDSSAARLRTDQSGCDSR